MNRFDGVALTGLNVLRNNFDDLAHGLPMLSQLSDGRMPLCATCNACQFRQTCGGGYLPHRYSRSNGFDNPSVWCSDIKRFLTHMEKRIQDLNVFSSELTNTDPVIGQTTRD